MAISGTTKFIWFLVGIIVILIGAILFLVVNWESQHLKDNWPHYAGAMMGSGGLISILPSLIDAIKNRNVDIIVKDLNKLYERGVGIKRTGGDSAGGGSKGGNPTSDRGGESRGESGSGKKRRGKLKSPRTPK